MAMLTLAFMKSLGVTEMLVLGVMALTVVIPIWGLIDAASRPEKQWLSCGINRVTWVLIMLLGTVFCFPVGAISALYYLALIRPKLDAVDGTPS